MPTEMLYPRRQQNVMADKIDNALETRTAKVMTLEEVSRYLHIHPATVYRLETPRDPSFRIGAIGGSTSRRSILAIEIGNRSLSFRFRLVTMLRTIEEH